MKRDGATEVSYDNRFGFAKYCTALWVFNSERVGEQFIFEFPNGIRVSVIRISMWNYNYAAALLYTAASHGFAFGRYEALVTDAYGREIFQDGMLNFKDVIRLLSTWRNKKTQNRL